MLTHLLGFVIYWFLAGVFIAALAHKLNQHQRFLASLQAYKLLPNQPKVIQLVGAVLTLLECLCVAALLLLQPFGLFMAAALLSVYFIAIAINMARGRQHIDCGCGDEPVALSWYLLARNGVLVMLAVAGGGLLTVSTGPAWLEAAVAAGLSLLALGIYQTFEQLLANSGLHRRLWTQA